MLQAMMQQNVLLYGIGILCILGAVSQFWLWGVYGRMTKDMENERGAKGKFIKQVRQRYGLLKRMGDGEVNTKAFIDRCLYQYRHLGRNLHQWRRTGFIALAVSLLLGAAGYYYSGTMNLSAAAQQNYLWAMGIAAVAMAAVYGLTDIRYKKEYLQTGLLDMLENSGQPQMVQKAKSSIGRDNFEASKALDDRRDAEKKAFGPVPAEAETAAADGDKLSLRKGKKVSRGESKSQQEKRELKENLSRIKASMGESAASMEKEKERNAEILKNMDPSEQERIIREVLKEFLS